MIRRSRFVRPRGARLRRSVPVVGAIAILLSLPLASFGGDSRAGAVETVFDPTSTSWQGSRAHTDAVLDFIASTGASTLRLQVTIGDPLNKLDYMVSAATQRGLGIIMTPAGPSPLNNTHLVPPAPRFSTFISFVRRLGARYPEVDRWAIWNEANLDRYFPLPRGMRPGSKGTRYRQVFLVAERALAATGHPPSQVYIGESSPKVTANFIRDTFCLNDHWRRMPGCRPIDAAGWTHHPYIAAPLPWQRSPHHLIGTGDLPQLHHYLMRAFRGGGTTQQLPIWVTEFGVRDNQPQQNGLGPASEWTMWRLPWVKSFAQYSIYYDWFGAGFYNADNQLEGAKYQSFVNPLFVYRGGSSETLWGHLRNNPGGIATLTYQDADGSTGTMTIQTDSDGYFQDTVPLVPGRAWSLNSGPLVRTYVISRR